MNSLNNLLMRAQLPTGEDPRLYGFALTNHPMNLTDDQLNREKLLVFKPFSFLLSCESPLTEPVSV